MNRDALERELGAARAERDQAQARATALADVLQAINASPQQPGPVFDMIIGKAMALCDAAFGALLTYEGDHLTLVAHRNSPPALAAYWETPQYVDPATATSRALREGTASQIVDLAQSENYRKRVPMTIAGVELGGIRTLVQVALRNERGPIGVFILYRREVRPFTDRQVATVEAFAAQAAIAMENARLLTEQREALDQQTATADILRVISQSPTDIEPVMVAVAKAAVRFCGAEDAHIFLRDGGEMVSSAHEGPLSSHRHGYRDVLDASNTARADTILEARVTHLPDTLAPDAEAAYRSIRENSIQHGFRAQLNAPMLRDGRAIGCICLRRRDPGAFTPRQIALLETFAAQAVIAIENVRLFTELNESLERQTATTEVLEVINASPGRLEPVLDAMLEKAMHLCEAAFGIFGRFDGQLFEPVVDRGVPAALIATTRSIQSPPPNSGLGRLAAGESVVQLVDLANTDVYRAGFVGATALVDIGGAKTAIFVALRKDDRLVGVIVMYRREVRAFSDKQVALLQNFAAQAVIAMENARLLTEQRESLEQQTATADILRVIAQSPTDVTPVLAAVGEAALRFCGAEDVAIDLREGEIWRCVAHAGILKSPMGMTNLVGPKDLPGRTMLARAVMQIPDIEATTGPETEFDRSVARHVGFRAALAAPLLRQDEAAGAIILHRRTPGAFSERQIALLESFAAQAVIALENTRLFTELRDSLEQQTATSEILGVISQSPTDVDPVLTAVAKAMQRFCGGEDAIIGLRDGDHWLIAGHEGPLPASIGTRVPLNRETSPGGAILDARTVHFPDIATLDHVEYAASHDFSQRQGFRAALAAPMLREGMAIGAVVLRRAEPGAFTPRQIELLEGFAAQAVIAIENTRLFTELRESLDYQTATSEVLEVISRSTSDLAPVLNKMLAAATHLCGVEKGDVSIRRDGQMRYAASIGTSAAEDTWLRTRIIAADRSTCAGRAMITRQVVHVLDQSADPELAVPRQISSHQTVLSVPLLREGEATGVITVLRDHVEAFTDRQIALIKTFADQAVIAIENARLLGELRERQSELRVTFDNMGDAVVMFDGHQRLAAWNRNFQEMLDVSDTFLAERPTLDDYVRLLVGRGELGEVDPDTEIARLRGQFERQWSTERTRPNGRILEVRNNPVPDGGAVLIYSDITERKKSESAIRSARDAAEAALLQLKAAQANLVQSEKMASLGQLTAGIAHEIKNPLNFVNNFATLSVDLLDELKEIAGPALKTLDADKRADLDETMGLLTGNLGKIAEHGKRADGIVKSMLSHSRGGSGDWQASDINALVEEALNLAYHGARAQDKEFNVTLERDFETESKPIEVVPQDVTRVFLNLFGNGFYAANKRRLAREAGYRPSLKVSTRDLGNAVEVKVRDNGIGIPTEVRAKLFQPFFTTKPTGEGTGLGLSISYDIVTQQHGGAIAVESMVGQFTEFTVRLPRVSRIASAKRV